MESLQATVNRSSNERQRPRSSSSNGPPSTSQSINCRHAFELTLLSLLAHTAPNHRSGGRRRRSPCFPVPVPAAPSEESASSSLPVAAALATSGRAHTGGPRPPPNPRAMVRERDGLELSFSLSSPHQFFGRWSKGSERISLRCEERSAHSPTLALTAHARTHTVEPLRPPGGRGRRRLPARRGAHGCVHVLACSLARPIGPFNIGAICVSSSRALLSGD